MNAAPFYTHFLSLALLLIVPAICNATETKATHAAEVIEYRYWDWGKTPTRDQYQYSLLQKALDATIPNYGPYRLQRVVAQLSTARARREINLDGEINIRVGSWLPLGDDKDSQVENNRPIPVHVLNNLLGYRQLLIRPEELHTFAEIRSTEQLKRLLIGQGRDWYDNRIYRANGFKVNDSAHFYSLGSMLSRRRFDYLPVSVIETKGFIDQEKARGNTIVAVPNMLIYYPFPSVFQVAPDQDEMAKRVEEGLKILIANGEMQRLLAQYFADELTLISAPDNRIFALDNPFISPQLPSPPPLLSP